MISVLIVEDQEIVLTGVRMALETDSQLKVVGVARDGSEATRVAPELNPDVVLMDIAMPVMNGIDATRELTRVMPDLKIVMLTSHERDDDIFGAFAAGAHGYCMKDISTNDLKLAIHSAASGASYLDPRIASRVLHAAKPAVPSSKSKSFESLSAREMEVLELIVEGLTNAEIAGRLYVSTETVKTHMRHIMEKLQVSDRTQAAVKAIRGGLVF